MKIAFQLATLLSLAGTPFITSDSHAQNVIWGAEHRSPAAKGHLSSLRNAPVPASKDGAAQNHIRELLKPPPIGRRGQVRDPIVQKSKKRKNNILTPHLSFDGAGVGLGNYTPSYAPPDPTGAVGATQYVQMVNADVAVFDKSTGALVYGPVRTNTLFQDLGGACAQNDSVDPIAQYDKAAKRWVLSGIAIAGPTEGFWQCIAVSKTSDATGGYNLYAYRYENLNDYPKVGVWPDAYYITFNMFAPSSGGFLFAGAQICAFDREKMLRGEAAEQQCVLLPNHASLMPADLDGSKAPPKGSPNYLISRDQDALNMWKFKVDWSNPDNTTLSGPFRIAVAPYNENCGTCVPQPDTNQLLDSLSDRMMYRLAYRNLHGVERMVINHSVMVDTQTSSGNLAVRWYEIRNMSTTPSIYQQASYSPDANFRWMASAAMDKQGNMAVGYSVSSSTVKPSIALSARLAKDEIGTLSNETILIDGTGSQFPFLSRWGDYTHMSVDPVDDCTFWYTGQYLKADGAFNWSTRIGSFKFSACH